MKIKKINKNNIIIYFSNISKREKLILSFTISFIFVVLGLKFLIFPQLKKYSYNLALLDTRRFEESKIENIINENEILEKKQKELKISYENSLKKISKTPAVAQIIYDLKDLFSESDIKIKYLNFDSSEIENHEDIIEKQIININLNGKYEDIINFIKTIENYSRIADVSSISFSSSEEKLLNASLVINFYNLNYKEDEIYEFNNESYGKENSFD